MTVFVLFIVGIIGFLGGGVTGDLIVKKKGLRFGRRFIGMFGLGMCSLFLFLSALTPTNAIAAYCLIASNGFFLLG